MAPSSAKRIAAMAVTRYGVDRARMKREVQMLLTGRGEAADLIQALVVKGLLTSGQGEELRAAAELPSRGSPQPPPAPFPRPGESNRLDPEPAPRLVGGYRILRRLGEGGMGAVYLAYDEAHRRQVAVKVLGDGPAANPVCVDLFYRESHSSLLLDHPGIVRGITAGWDEIIRKHYLVREYVDGPSTYALLDRLGRLPVGDVVQIGLQLARTLDYLHGCNYVHRDIKPDNVLLSWSGSAKLTDLGLLKRIGEPSSSTALQRGFGTSYYMPYEQAVNPRTVDGRSDLYALGATLYHLLTGQVPFLGDNHLEIIQKKDIGVFTPASELNRDVPAVLDGILAKALARRPRDRYQSAAELAADLERSGLASALPRIAEADENGVVNDFQEPPHSANQPTSMDFQRLGRRGALGGSRNNVWYLRYQDATGRWCKTKATTKQLLRRLQDGRMPANAKVCQELHGPYLPLAAVPPFQDRVPSLPAKSTPPVTVRVPVVLPSSLEHPGSLGWLLILRLMLGVGGLVGVGIALYSLLHTS